MNREVVLSSKDLGIGYDLKDEKRLIFEKLDLDLYRGELLCLLGPNGIGKSTLIRSLMGLQKPLAGEIAISGRPISEYTPADLAKKIATMITERVDVDYLNVKDLVSIGRYPHTHWLWGMKDDDHIAVDRALEAMELDDFKERSFANLSDGEKQRVLIARALAQDTDILLFDEPTSFLDLPHKVESMRLLRSWARQQGKAILLSTHDYELTMNIADRVWLMQKDKTLSQGAPEDLILNGNFAKCFDSEHVHINPSTGHFEISLSLDAEIQLKGEGANWLSWTRHALTRAGYQVREDDLSLRVVQGEGEHAWIVEKDERKESYSSLYDCLNRLAELIN